MKKLIAIYMLIGCLQAIAQPAFVHHDICDVSMGTSSSTPDHFIQFKGDLYFSAYDSLGYNPHVTSGTTPMPQLLYNVHTMVSQHVMMEAMVCKDRLVFTASNALGVEVWATDGTTGNTNVVYDINPAGGSSWPYDFTMYDSTVFFIATSKNIKKLYKTDGMPANVQTVYQVPGTGGVYDIIGIAGGKLIFLAWSTTYGYELYATDGTTAGTTLLKDIYPGSNQIVHTEFITYKNKLYFSGKDNTHGKELWVTDGTPAGTKLVLDINPGIDDGAVRHPIIMDSMLYFTAYDGINGCELWKSDGTDTGTHIVVNIKSKLGSGASGNTIFTVFKHKLYFIAEDEKHGLELWRSDGTDTGTYMVKDILEGNPGSGVYEPMFDGGQYLYFIADDGVNGKEIWITDGTKNGTTLLKDINPGKNDSSPLGFCIFKNKVVFSALSRNLTRDLYVTDGTTAGTGKLAPTMPILMSSTNPLDTLWFKGFTLYDNALFFCAQFDHSGKELWILTDPSLPPVLAIPKIPIATDITLFPNPTQNNITIKTTYKFTTGYLKLTDVTGRVVKTEKLYNNEQTISLSGIAPGIYIADVWLDDKRNTQRLIVN